MVIILNADARNVSLNPDEMRSKVAAQFATGGERPQIIVAEGKNVGAIARYAVAGNEKTIVAGGGDGTVGTVAAEIADTKKTLGVLPLGTLNHFARDLRIPLHLEGAVRIVIEHHHVMVDVAEVNGRGFVNNSGLGIYPQIVALREAQQQWLKRKKFRGARLRNSSCLSSGSVSRSSHHWARKRVSAKHAVHFYRQQRIRDNRFPHWPSHFSEWRDA